MHDDWLKLGEHYSSRSDILIVNAKCETSKSELFKSCPPDCKDGSGKELCDHFQVSVYPTLLYGPKADEAGLAEYVGDRDYASLLAFAQNHLEPGPSPPSPPAPAPTQPHYGSPPCNADETILTIGDAQVCAALCSDNCPTDSATGDYGNCHQQGFQEYCTIGCIFDSQCDTAHGGICADVPGSTGICAYPASQLI